MHRLFLVLLLLLTIRLVNAQPQHEYVDLGLPSGTLWATSNIGAENNEGLGYYFSWGGTERITPSLFDEILNRSKKKLLKRKKVYGVTTEFNKIYKFYTDGYCRKITKYCSLLEYGNEGYTDSLSTLESIDDAASKLWGNDWCIPTSEQWRELAEQCTWKLVWRGEWYGYKVVGPNKQSMFLPKSGYRSDFDVMYVPDEGCYWSSSLNTEYPCTAFSIYFDSEKIDFDCLTFRDYGLTIRPVRRENVE